MDHPQAWGMTETSPVGLRRSRRRSAIEGDDEWRYRATQGRFSSASRAGIVGRDGSEQPWDGEAVGELEVRGPWITASYYDTDDTDGGREVPRRLAAHR